MKPEDLAQVLNDVLGEYFSAFSDDAALCQINDKLERLEIIEQNRYARELITRWYNTRRLFPFEKTWLEDHGFGEYVMEKDEPLSPEDEAKEKEIEDLLG